MILKLGGFAIIRFVLPLFKNSYTYQKNLSSIFTVITVSMIFVSLTALYQTDLKRIIAHSSIEHMNLSLLGLVMGTPVSLTGGFILMLAHG
jgi:NADH:ubiquinone oxidoreductase subunit 4 (subunit M)